MHQHQQLATAILALPLYEASLTVIASAAVIVPPVLFILIFWLVGASNTTLPLLAEAITSRASL